MENRVPLLKASQVSSSPSSSLETLWVMLDMVVIPPLAPCRQKAHMTVQSGDRQPLSGIVSLEGKKKKIREKNNPQWFVLANTDGKLAAVITDVVHGL